MTVNELLPVSLKPKKLWAGVYTCIYEPSRAGIHSICYVPGQLRGQSLV